MCFKDAQSITDWMQNDVTRCRTILKTSRRDLAQAWTSNAFNDEMLRILSIMSFSLLFASRAVDSRSKDREDVIQVPNRIEEFCASKFYLTATRLLLDTLTTLDTPDLKNIQALRDIRRYCLAKKEVMTRLGAEANQC